MIGETLQHQRAQKNQTGPRRGHFARRPLRGRVGLAMRRAMNFGEMGDVERVMQGEGLSLAPIATGDAGLALGGVSVMPTATLGDISEGRLVALIVPGGTPDAEAEARMGELMAAARARNVPVFAFGEGVALAARAFEIDPVTLAEHGGVVFTGGDALPIRDESQLEAAAAAIR